MERSNPGISAKKQAFSRTGITTETAHILLIDDDINYLNLTAENS